MAAILQTENLRVEYGGAVPKLALKGLNLIEAALAELAGNNKKEDGEGKKKKKKKNK
jgi:hypothetical protein